MCEKAGINDKYLSCIERATSIPSLEVLMKLAIALDTTPDAFLTGTVRHQENEWQDVAQMIQHLDPAQLKLAKCFIGWLSTQKL